MICCVCLLPWLALGLVSVTGLMPSDKVIEGRQMLSFDIKYLQRKAVLKPKDDVELFYSDGFISAREDGNGFSNRHVFSYWREDNKFEYETAEYADISDIDVTWSKDWYEDTVIDIVRKDKTNFLLFVSNEQAKDKVFVEALKKRWQQSKSVE
jgi:hypothetical protein